ncbi:2-oxoglutarate dehydrogenase complex dihydrolipoyllysine-residue succinyltransferase [uncultured Cyclobacterium sp.]|uniref:2-oxoglutarate dehydrogenase complex dihydrolipoyllysine-residue succinyltransferase n=1 Tax=uncultured Cyclobacterium sp. TaxID=453820 RepID=UPI0030EE7047|tara:strand:- start:17272 stop:18834 length:1563 start_codon:yes stop_codon:yes gene_type:complete
MSIVTKVPAVGESITEVTIGQWFKKDGEFVEMDEVICELESDKATFELTAESSGVLYTKADEGDTLEIGAVICEIDTEGKEQEATEDTEVVASEEKTSNSSSPAPSKSSGEVKEMHVPAVGESITEVTLASWIKTDGDYVELDEIIAEVDSDKATFELPAEASGILRHVAGEGDTLEIGGLICKIEVRDGAPEASNEASGNAGANASEDKKPTGNETYATGHASPAASKILSEKGVDPATVKGSGKDGRITKEDAEKAEKAKPAAPATAKNASKPAATDNKDTAVKGERGERREKMTSLRKTISRRLVAVKNETAMLTTFNEVNMKPIMDIRKQYKDKFKERYEVNLGFMSFFTKAACIALEEWPAVNAQIDGNEIIYHDYCDISIAVSSPKGLVVPVIRNAENLSFSGVEKEVVRLAVKARDGKLSIDEMTGGTFTLTNGGIFGSMMSTPIINAPQAAILGMHNIVERPMAVNGEVKILPMMYLALSYDHRIIDGRESVSFLVRLKELLEDPARLMLGI